MPHLLMLAFCLKGMLKKRKELNQHILIVKFLKWGQRPSFSNGEINRTKSTIKARNKFSEPSTNV